MAQSLFDNPLATLSTAVVPTTDAISENRRKLEEKTRGLSVQDRSQIDSMKNSLVPGDFSSISKYAQGTNNITTQVVETVLKAANSTSLDAVGGGINNILMTAKKIDAKQLMNAKHGNFLTKAIPWLFTTKERLVAQFSSLGEQIDKYSKEIAGSLKTTDDSIKLMEQMGKACIQQYNVLEVSILAGAVRAEELRKEFEAEQAEFKALPPDQVDPLRVQELQKKEQFIDTLEKQVSNLEQMQQVVYLQIPQLSMMVKNAVDTRTEFQQIIDMTIPLWKSQFTQALVLDQQQRAGELIKATKDYTNTMLRANADNLKTSTLQLAEQGARGLVDKETLEHVQSQLIQTIEGSLAIHNKARDSRAQISQSIDKLRLDFKTSLQGH